jgi:hypothetical protein
MTGYEIDGATALATHAPEAGAAYDRLVGVRPLGVRDELLDDPEVAAFTADLAAGVETDDAHRARLVEVTGEDLDSVVQMVWIADTGSRLRATLDAVFGPSAWESPRRYPVADVRGVVDAFVETATMSAATDAAADGGAAARLAEAMTSSPHVVGDDVVQAVRSDLSPAQAVSVVLGAAASSSGRIADALPRAPLG